jgi:hypothetical protein
MKNFMEEENKDLLAVSNKVFSGMKENANIVKIYAAYPWNVICTNDTEDGKKKNKFSPSALKELINQIQKRLDSCEQKQTDVVLPKLFYSRLRATCGSFVFSSIRERMTSAYAIIFDITDYNPNVMLELGIALELQQNLEHSAKVFLIAHSENYSDTLLPSDLRGYFLTTYKYDEKKNKVIFGDNGSLVMRIVSDIISLKQISYIENEE